jgi:hypothetical protein
MLTGRAKANRICRYGVKPIEEENLPRTQVQAK